MRALREEADMTDEDLSKYKPGTAQPKDLKFYNGDLYQRWETEYFEGRNPKPVRVLSTWKLVPKYYGSTGP